jgi:hypothetical protein
VKTKRKLEKAQPAARVSPSIEASRTYNTDEAARALRMRKDRLKAEVDAGRLKCKVDGRRRVFLGAWLLAWLAA